MLNFNLKRKIPETEKVAEVKLHKNFEEFSVWRLLASALIFVSIGGYITYRSLAINPVPLAPTSLAEVTMPGGIVNLSWTAPVDQSVTGYKIYQNSPSVAEFDDNSSSSSSSIYIGATTQTSYQVTGLLDNSAYDFYVVAVDSSGNASDPSNHTLADTSGAQLKTASSLRDLDAATRGTTSSFPYSSPFGDQNCDPNKITSDTSDDCVKNCTGSSGCGGSCIIVPETDTLGNTGTCRPMTFQTCKTSDGVTPDGIPGSTIFPTQVDPGVDYNVTFPQPKNPCTYNNPNPKDTETGDFSKSAVTNTRIYAMGAGVITCVASNPGYSLPHYCPGDTRTMLSPGDGPWVWLVYKLTQQGGAAQGRMIYVSESCNLAANAIRNVTAPDGTGTAASDRYLGRLWRVGDHVDKNSVLCEMRNAGVMETGWANEGDQVMSSTWTIKSEIVPAAYKCYKEHDKRYGIWSTAWGHSFNYFVLKSDGNRFSGPAGPYAYHDCANFPLQAKYKNSAWYPQ